jgi:hypothetical protein
MLGCLEVTGEIVVFEIGERKHTRIEDDADEGQPPKPQIPLQDHYYDDKAFRSPS